MYFRTNDGVKLHYTSIGAESGFPLILLHSWSANGKYFCRNVPGLSKSGLQCFTLDYRHMGESEKPGHGFRVSRLAADLHCFINYLNLSRKPVLCGSSIGFTVISLFMEIYGQQSIAGVCFIDQSCAMYHRPGWVTGKLTHSVSWKMKKTGAPDLSNPAMCAELLSTLKLDFANLADGIVSGGFGEVSEIVSSLCLE